MPTRVAGYDEAQIANAAVIASVAVAWGMGERGALLGIMCAMGESSLRNIDYGDWETSGVRNPDGSPTTSIGLFQQQAWWGSPADRMDPIYSSWKFFEALGKINGWRGLEPTIAIHRVQINADPNHYAKYENAARAVLNAIPDLRAKGILMADPMDVIEVPWQKGNYARRALVDAVARAGKPRGNSWGRLKDEQQRAWNAYQNGTGNPADNPNDPNNYELGHVRFAAVDIDYSPEMDRKLKAQGLVTPFSWEKWHYRLPGDVRKWPLVTSIPSTAGSDAKPFPEPNKDWLMALSDKEQQELLNNTRQVYNAFFQGGPSMSDQGRSVAFSLGNITEFLDRIDQRVLSVYQANFDGGPSMPDEGNSIGKSLAEIRADVADLRKALNLPPKE